jgi:hypothetical protein
MKKIPLSLAVAAAFTMSNAYALDTQEDNKLDIGRLAIAGYGDISYADQDDTNNNVVSRFVPIFLFQMSEKIHIESELEFSVGADGETETILEYANMHYFLNDNTIITAGKFLLPFGQFGANLHPSWINKAASKPGVYGGHGGNGSLGGIIPILSDTGFNVSNTFDFGNGGKIFTDFYVVSGPRQEAAGGHGEGEEEEGEEGLGIEVPEVEFEYKAGDNNDSMAFGGRIAYAFLPQWEVGVSYYNGAYSDDGDLDYTATNIDINWIGTYASVRAEIINTTAEGEGEIEIDGEHEEIFQDFEKDGWYVQGTWQARQLGKSWLNPVEFVVRYSELSDDQDEHDTVGGDRMYYGVNYWLEPSAVLKLGVESTNLDNGEDSDDRVFAQLAFGF